MLAFLSKQLGVTFARHNAGADTVQLCLSQSVVVNALREFDYEDNNPNLATFDGNKKMQLRFPAAQLNGKKLHVDFEVGDRCYVNGPVQLQPAGTSDDTKWELKYYRASADGLLISVGLGSND